MPYSQGTPGAPGGATAAVNPNYFQIAKQQMGSSNPGTAAGGVVAGGQAPTVAGADVTMAQLLQEIGLVVPNVQEQEQSMNLQNDYSLEGAGIGYLQNQLQQTGLAAQLGLTNVQQGYEQAQYGLSQQQYPEQLAQAATANQQAVMSNQAQQAIGGTASTPGAKLTNAAQAQNYAFQQADINRAQQTAALGQASEQAGYQYSAGDIARSQQNLQLTAQQNGISVKQLLAQWQQGLQQLGINADPTQLYTQWLSAQNQGVTAVGNVAGQEGLLTPNQLSSAAMNGNFNPTSLFAGNIGNS